MTKMAAHCSPSFRQVLIVALFALCTANNCGENFNGQIISSSWKQQVVVERYTLHQYTDQCVNRPPPSAVNIQAYAKGGPSNPTCFVWEEWKWEINRTLEKSGDLPPTSWPTEEEISLNRHLSSPGEHERSKNIGTYTIKTLSTNGEEQDLNITNEVTFNKVFSHQKKP